MVFIILLVFMVVIIRHPKLNRLLIDCTQRNLI